MKPYIQFIINCLKVWLSEIQVWFENVTGIAERKRREFFEGMRKIEL